MDEVLLTQFDKILDYSFQVFKEKHADYGPTWLLYRYSSLVDEIWRKIKRVRTLEEKDGDALIPEGRDVEYIGVINYCIMYLMRLDPSGALPGIDEAINDLEGLGELDPGVIFALYRRVADQMKDLLFRKNSDYGGAWRGMSLHSMTDQVIVRVFRIKTILNNDGHSKKSEGIDAQLQDIVNYCIFALLKMDTDIVR